MNEFAEWDSFYLIVGGAAGALIGLQFVVMTLIAQRMEGASASVGQAFSTPTVLHFSVVLFIAAMIRAPWHSIVPPAVIGGLIGTIGVGYVIYIVDRMRKQETYDPVFEDWLFHFILPFAAYLAFVVLAFVAASNVRVALFGTAAASLTLLFTGIHNSWDAVTWFVFARPDDAEPPIENEKEE